MSFTNFDSVRAGYANLWNKAQIKPQYQVQVQTLAQRMVNAKAQYEPVAGMIGCPWWFVAAIHNLESSMNFRTHLHNGDPLSRRTVHVPAGRPIAGNPPFTWTESALDALKMHGIDKVSSWEIPRCLYEWEAYNGRGYWGKINSPYVWSKTTLYDRGKYVADHVYSNAAVSEQIGAAAVLKALVASGAAMAKPPLSIDDLKPAPMPVADKTPSVSIPSPVPVRPEPPLPIVAKPTFLEWIKSWFTR